MIHCIGTGAIAISRKMLGRDVTSGEEMVGDGWERC
jgi:hypothetical protein